MGPSSSAVLPFPPSENCRWPSVLSNTWLPPPGQSLTRRTSGKERNRMLIESEFVTWISETKGLYSAWTLAYCSSWQLGNLLPSAGHPLPPSGSQSANPASCLLCDSVRGSQAVHVTGPVHPGFAKTVPARGLLRVVVGKREASTTLLLLR